VDTAGPAGVPTTSGGRREGEDSKKWRFRNELRADPASLRPIAASRGANPASRESGARFSLRIMAPPTPRPADALRQHTRAVVLTAPGGDISPIMLDQIRDSTVPFELIGHPLVAMAELARLEREVSPEGDPERTALVVCERDDFDDLNGLFDAVRSRLPRVSIWVFAGGLSVEVQRGRPPEPLAHADVRTRPAPSADAPAARPIARPAPALRITDAPLPPSEADSDVETDAAGAPLKSGGPVTPEELEMLLDLFEPPSGGDRPAPGGAR
jgi:hypothetical protein